MKQENEQLKQEIVEKEDELYKAYAKINILEEENQNLDLQNMHLVEERDNLNKIISSLEDNISKLQISLQLANEEIA